MKKVRSNFKLGIVATFLANRFLRWLKGNPLRRRLSLEFPSPLRPAIPGTILLTSSLLFFGGGCSQEKSKFDVQNLSASFPIQLLAEANGGKKGEELARPPKHLGIFYGQPSDVNGTYNVDKAVKYFSAYDLLVWGDKLWDNHHPNHDSAKKIILQLKQIKPGLKIFGYVDVGFNEHTHHHSEDTLKTYIDGWKAFGVDGVFGDDFGDDFGVSRQRQNFFIDYAHEKGLSVFANSWKVVDALGGDDCHLGSEYNDYFLLESHLLDSGKYQPWTDFLNKSRMADSLGTARGVKIACNSTVMHDQYRELHNLRFLHRSAWVAATIFGFEAFQLSAVGYSAQTCDLVYYPSIIEEFGSQWLDPSPRIGNNPHYLLRETDRYIFLLRSDGNRQYESEIISK